MGFLKNFTQSGYPMCGPWMDEWTLTFGFLTVSFKSDCVCVIETRREKSEYLLMPVSFLLPGWWHERGRIVFLWRISNQERYWCALESLILHVNFCVNPGKHKELRKNGYCVARCHWSVWFQIFYFVSRLARTETCEILTKNRQKLWSKSSYQHSLPRESVLNHLSFIKPSLTIHGF